MVREVTGQTVVLPVVIGDFGVGLGITPAAFRQLRVFSDSTPPANILPIEQRHVRVEPAFEVCKILILGLRPDALG